MQQYTGTKTVTAEPMTRAAYNVLREWELPADENGEDIEEGDLDMDLDIDINTEGEPDVHE